MKGFEALHTSFPENAAHLDIQGCEKPKEERKEKQINSLQISQRLIFSSNVALNQCLTI